MKGLELATTPISVETTLTVLEKIRGKSKVYIQKTKDSFKNLAEVEEVPVKSKGKERILKIKDVQNPQSPANTFAGFFDLAYNCFNYFFTNENGIPNFKLLEVLSNDNVNQLTDDDIITLYNYFNSSKVPYKFNMTPEKKFDVILKNLKGFLGSLNETKDIIKKEVASKYEIWLEEAFINNRNLSFENQAEMLRAFYFESFKESVRELMCYLKDMYVELNIDFNLEIYMNFNTFTALLESNPNTTTLVILKVTPSVDNLSLSVRNGSFELNKI